MTVNIWSFFPQPIVGKLLNFNIAVERYIVPQMKIILATDPMLWPLTGIGRYTFELVKKLGSESRITDIRFFNMGRWQESAEFARFDHESKDELSNPRMKRWGYGALRKSLSSNKQAIKVYSLIAPHLYARRLKPFSADYIYHSPNFMLPPYSGKKVATFHDLSTFKHPEFHPEARISLLHPEITKAAKNADHIITPSEAVRQEVIEFFSKSEEEVTAVPQGASFHNNFPDSVLLDSFLRHHMLENRQFILFVSSIEPRKNIGRLLDAYEALTPAFRKQYPLVLTGSSGWKSRDILARIKSMKDAGEVRYLGYTSEAELACLYSTAGALVFPSIYEGFGLPIIEAQAMGVPVVTSNVSCMPEVAGGAALLVNPYDVDSIGEALGQIMLDEGLRQNLKAQGLKNASQYSWEKTVAKTVDVYSRL